jgi:hypothetical protein
MESVVKVFVHQDGKRRVLIVRHPNGSHGFEEEYWSDGPLELCWCRCTKNPLTICDTLETAEREALGRIGWLAGFTF